MDPIIPEGWVYFRVRFDSEVSLDATSVQRSDGRQLLAQHNVWIDVLQDDETYLQILDYFSVAQDTYSYDISFTTANLYAPSFTQQGYTVNVTEDALLGTQLAGVQATGDDDDQTVSYMLQSTGVPFIMSESTGTLTIIGVLDRETEEEYTLTVLAVDDGTPARTTTTAIRIQVVDINDNSPVFDRESGLVTVEENVDIGHLLYIVAATDADDGDNGDVTITTSWQGSHFAYNASSGLVTVAESLIGLSGHHELIFTASDHGVEEQSTMLNVTVAVVPTNMYAPVFLDSVYRFMVSEGLQINMSIGAVVAVDDDEDSYVTYALPYNYGGLAQPFQVNAQTGVISLTRYLDRERETMHNLTVQAVDGGGVPRTAQVQVYISVSDLNDNAPVFDSPTSTAQVAEDITPGTIILKVSAHDLDAGANGEIAKYALFSTGARLPFVLSASGDEAGTLTLQTPLDRETVPEYHFLIVATDGGLPPISSSTEIFVLVEDVNDNPPFFVADVATQTVLRTSAINALIYTAHALDADIGVNGGQSNVHTKLRIISPYTLYTNEQNA